MATKNDKFVFKQSFYTNFDKLCGYINDTTAKIKKVKPRDFTYGSCNTGYNLRFITPENISTFIDNYINALKMKLIDETFADAQKFMVASIKKMLAENGCPEINCYTVNTRPMYVNQQAQTPSDLIRFVEGEIVKSSIYSASQIQKRFELIQEDMKIMDKHNFVIVTKRIVDALPKIISDKNISHILTYKMTGEVLMDIIGQFIMFTATLNALTLKGMWLYTFPKQTLGISIPVSPERQNKAFVESACLKTDPQLIPLTDGIPMNKTNMVMMKEKLPIDMNIKNIVMMDQSRAFDETVSALKFMLTDERSPITHLILKYVDTENRPTQQMFVNTEYKYDIMNITKMFIKYNTSQEGKRHEDSLFQTDRNWLDLIVSGNDFVDHNYRRDTVTNNVNTNPIVNTLEMVYRVYGECLTENKDLVASIIKISNIMVAIAEEYNLRNIQNRPIVKDILIVFAEIITRNMLQLYWNNNPVVDYGMRLHDTPVTDFMYTDSDIMQEMFLMEAEQKPIVNAAQERAGKTGGTIKILLQKFTQWISESLGRFSAMFKQKHSADIQLIRNQSKLNDEIGQAIDNGIFTPKISDWVEYKIPYSPIKTKAQNLSATINKALNSAADITPDMTTFETDLLPTGITIEELKDPKNAKASNFVLFGDVAGAKPQEHTITTSKQWKDLIANIIDADKAIEDLSTVITSELKKATQACSAKITQESIQEVVAANEAIFQEEVTNVAKPQTINHQSQAPNTNQPSTPTEDGAQNPAANIENSKSAVVFKNIIQPISTSWYTPALNTIRNIFFAKSLENYKGIISLYQQNSFNSQQPAPAATGTNQPVVNTPAATDSQTK